MATPIAVEYEGHKFSSISEAAKQYGITPAAMAYRMKSEKTKRPGRPKKPFEILGMKFASRNEASEKMGISYDQMSCYCSVLSRARKYQLQIDGLL